MEENKSKKSVSSVLAVLIITILVLGLAVCISYIMKNNEQKLAINNNDTEQTINALKSEIDSLKNTIAQQENQIKNYENKEPVTETKEMTADEKFAKYVKNLKAIMSKYNREEIEGKKYREYHMFGKNANDANYSIELSGNGILKLGQKEVSNKVIGFNVAYYGNGGYKALYFIKEDGTVAYASIDETEYLSNGKIKTTNVKGLKNIVSIMGGVAGTYGYPGACYAYAIDIEGNMFEI